MKTYKDKFLSNLDAEIVEFRERTLLQSPQEIYDDAARISFYEYMDDYLRKENFETSEYKMFLQSDTNFIYNLWRASTKWDDFNIGSAVDASCLVDTYIQDCLSESEM